MAHHKRLILWLVGLALVCCVGSLLLPVWSMNIRFLSGGTYVDAFSFGVYATSETSLFPSGFTFIADLSSGMQLALGLLMVMTFITILALAIQLSILRRTGETAKGYRLSDGFIVSALLTFATPAIFAFLWPSALTRTEPGQSFGFWGKITELTVSVTYGPNIGWVLLVLAFILIGASCLIIMFSREVEQPAIGTRDSAGVTPGSAVVERSEDLFCSKCGRRIPSDARLCPYCGEEVRR